MWVSCSIKCSLSCCCLFCMPSTFICDVFSVIIYLLSAFCCVGGDGAVAHGDGGGMVKGGETGASTV